MTAVTNWILTDVANGTWHDSFRIDHSCLADSVGVPWSVTKRTLRGGRSDGVDLIEVNNGGLRFSILPTRGMSVWRGDYHGLRLGWQAPIVGPIHPAFVNLADRSGLGWLDGFDEWMCRCGLHSNGPPIRDPVTNEQLPLHGRIANCPAHFVDVFVDGNPPRQLGVRGVVEEGTLFMGRLRLTTTIVTPIDGNMLAIQDVIENLASRPADLELLYHCQFTTPFVGPGSRIHVPASIVAPRDAVASQGVASWDRYDAPTSGYAEQVFYCRPLSGADGQGMALLSAPNEDKGVAVRFDARTLPQFVIWKNTGAVEDGYLTGLEPATNFPNPKPFERERGRVLAIPPGGRYETHLAFEIYDDPTGVARARTEVERLQSLQRVVVHDRPIPEFSP